MIFRGSSLLHANNTQWNLLKMFLENFRKTVYGFEEVCFAEVVNGLQVRFLEKVGLGFDFTKTQLTGTVLGL